MSSSRPTERVASNPRRLPDAEYHPLWIARLIGRTTRTVGGCLIWQGSKNHKGYAQAQYRGKSVNAHRRIYEITHNVRLRTEQFVCHTCDVPACINPDHLWLGSNSDNQRDASRKGRHQEKKRTHCPRGHAYTPENTYYKPLSSGRLAGARSCKLCARIRMRLKAGWPEHLAVTLPPTPPGHRVVS